MAKTKWVPPDEPSEAPDSPKPYPGPGRVRTRQNQGGLMRMTLNPDERRDLLKIVGALLAQESVRVSGPRLEELAAALKDRSRA